MSRFDDLILGQPLPATISCDFPLRFNGCRRGGLLYSARSRDFAQPVVAAAAAARYALDKHEITNRVLGLLRSFHSADPAKVFGVVENTSCFGCPNCGTKSYIFGQEEAQRTAEEMDMKFLAEDFFGKPAFLTVSGQLNAETYASSLSDLADSAKAQFSCRDYSDHLALVRAYEGWKDSERDHSGYEYC